MGFIIPVYKCHEHVAHIQNPLDPFFGSYPEMQTCSRGVAESWLALWCEPAWLLSDGHKMMLLFDVWLDPLIHYLLMVNLNIGHRYDENCTEKSRKSQNKLHKCKRKWYEYSCWHSKLKCPEKQFFEQEEEIPSLFGEMFLNSWSLWGEVESEARKEMNIK